MIRRPPRSTRTDTLFPDTTLFRSHQLAGQLGTDKGAGHPFPPGSDAPLQVAAEPQDGDRQKNPGQAVGDTSEQLGAIEIDAAPPQRHQQNDLRPAEQGYDYEEPPAFARAQEGDHRKADVVPDLVAGSPIGHVG